MHSLNGLYSQHAYKVRHKCKARPNLQAFNGAYVLNRREPLLIVPMPTAGLDIHIPSPKIQMLKPNPQSDGIRRWGLGQVVRWVVPFWWG